MTKTKHANDLKSTYFEGDKIFLRAILINISFKPTFSGCLCPVSMHGVFHITNWIVYKQSYWVCSVYSFTYRQCRRFQHIFFIVASKRAFYSLFNPV